MSKIIDLNKYKEQKMEATPYHIEEDTWIIDMDTMIEHIHKVTEIPIIIVEAVLMAEEDYLETLGLFDGE